MLNRKWRCSLRQLGQGMQYGRVSATELVQAVHDMLSASGISIDTEKQALMQMNLTLQEQLRESEVALLVEQVCAPISVSFLCKVNSVYVRRLMRLR